MSELDENSKAMVLSLINQYQTILTTADHKVLAELQEKIKKLKLIRLSWQKVYYFITSFVANFLPVANFSIVLEGFY